MTRPRRRLTATKTKPIPPKAARISVDGSGTGVVETNELTRSNPKLKVSLIVSVNGTPGPTVPMLMYGNRSQNFLQSFAELDCYPQRRCTEYLGAWSANIGDPPQWPPAIGRKVFGYLKPFPELHQLLHALSRLPNPTLIYAPGIDPRLRTQFQSEHLRFADGPVEMSQAARECDLAILNGTFASTTAMLLAGKPALHIPIFLEQATNARAVERLGAGICASPINAAAIVAGLRCLLALDQYAQSAKQFATRYASFDPDRQIQRVIDRIERLATDNVPS